MLPHIFSSNNRPNETLLSTPAIVYAEIEEEKFLRRG